AGAVGFGAVGRAAPAAAPKSVVNSANCESGCQFAIPSFQPRSVPTKRPARMPSRTCSSGNAPRLVAPRLTWIIAIIPRFSDQCAQSQRFAQVKWLNTLQRLQRNLLCNDVTFLTFLRLIQRTPEIPRCD